MDRFKKKSPTAPASAKPPAATAKKEAVVSDKKNSAEKTAYVSSASAPVSELAYRVIVKPLVTEKTAVLQSQNQYTFVVATWANKINVKEAVQALYGVTPLSVNLVNVQGHRMRFGQSAGKRSDYKKAIITLAPGQSITVHQGV